MERRRNILRKGLTYVACLSFLLPGCKQKEDDYAGLTRNTPFFVNKVYPEIKDTGGCPVEEFDVDGDTRRDIVRLVPLGRDVDPRGNDGAGSIFYDWDITVELNLGEGKYLKPMIIQSVPRRPHLVDFRDVNSDGLPDLVVLENNPEGAGKRYILNVGLNRGDCRFDAGTTYATFYRLPTSQELERVLGLR